ncbi:hypothetical protein ACLB2K_055469 [Fragaria x ananassa]
MATDVILPSSVEEEETRHGDQGSEQIKEKQLVSRQKFQRFDSLDIESRSINNHRNSKGASWSVILTLAFQSIGVVYGDLGTSPLYVFSSTFPNGIKDKDDILGVLSLILYTVTLIPLIKYVLIVLQANDNGDFLSAVVGIKGAATSAMTQGAEALFADVGHFTVQSIQISTCAIVYPSVVLAYIGQASFLRKHADLVADTFFKSTPALSSIIASQSLISATFSIIQQGVFLE